MTSKSEPGAGCGNGEPLRTQSANSLPWMSSRAATSVTARKAVRTTMTTIPSG